MLSSWYIDSEIVGTMIAAPLGTGCMKNSFYVKCSILWLLTEQKSIVKTSIVKILRLVILNLTAKMD